MDKYAEYSIALARLKIAFMGGHTVETSAELFSEDLSRNNKAMLESLNEVTENFRTGFKRATKAFKEYEDELFHSADVKSLLNRMKYMEQALKVALLNAEALSDGEDKLVDLISLEESPEEEEYQDQEDFADEDIADEDKPEDIVATTPVLDETETYREYIKTNLIDRIPEIADSLNTVFTNLGEDSITDELRNKDLPLLLSTLESAIYKTTMKELGDFYKDYKPVFEFLYSLSKNPLEKKSPQNIEGWYNYLSTTNFFNRLKKLVNISENISIASPPTTTSIDDLSNGTDDDFDIADEDQTPVSVPTPTPSPAPVSVPTPTPSPAPVSVPAPDPDSSPAKVKLTGTIIDNLIKSSVTPENSEKYIDELVDFIKAKMNSSEFLEFFSKIGVTEDDLNAHLNTLKNKKNAVDGYSSALTTSLLSFFTDERTELIDSIKEDRTVDRDSFFEALKKKVEIILKGIEKVLEGSTNPKETYRNRVSYSEGKPKLDFVSLLFPSVDMDSIPDTAATPSVTGVDSGTKYTPEQLESLKSSLTAIRDTYLSPVTELIRKALAELKIPNADSFDLTIEKKVRLFHGVLTSRIGKDGSNLTEPLLNLISYSYPYFVRDFNTLNSSDLSNEEYEKISLRVKNKMQNFIQGIMNGIEKLLLSTTSKEGTPTTPAWEDIKKRYLSKDSTLTPDYTIIHPLKRIQEVRNGRSSSLEFEKNNSAAYHYSLFKTDTDNLYMAIPKRNTNYNSSLITETELDKVYDLKGDYGFITDVTKPAILEKKGDKFTIREKGSLTLTDTTSASVKRKSRIASIMKAAKVNG